MKAAAEGEGCGGSGRVESVLPDGVGAAAWFTAAELAELRLPGLSADKRSLNRKIADEGWSLKRDSAGHPLARRRAGRGGGLEFHVSLLPGPARLELVRRGLFQPSQNPQPAPATAGSWRWFDQQPEKVRAEARRRLAAIAEILVLEGAGLTRSAAVAQIAEDHAVGKATLWSWLRLVEGVAASDRLPALAPRRQGGGAEAEVDPLVWQAFKSDFLRPSAPTLSSCYGRACDIARERGLAVPSERTMRRKLEREIDPRIVLLKREGEEALRRSIPAQRRTVAHLHALEHVNVDGHKFDVFVRLDDGRITRPLMVAIQDIASGKFVGWRVGEAETALLTRLAFADVFERFGIPKACTLDNGRAFASKEITGGAKTRYRFKVKPEDPTGLLTGLGIAIHWAQPYRGQSKPIERAFRDLCDTIARHPAMEGAYTGNRPDAKPENYASRAIPMAEFLAHVDAGMKAHNARLGRRGRDYRGRSFDQVFAESYATAPIGRATPEQMRMALLAAENVLVNRQTGEVQLHGNRYWSQECAALHGQRVTVRFDPDQLKRDIHLYNPAGSYLGAMGMIDDSGFDDVAGARETKKRLAEYRKTVRDGLDAEQLLAAHQVAALLPKPAEPELPAPAVLRPVRYRGQVGSAALKAPEATPQNSHEARIFAALGGLRVVE